jgi:hypothetical protein
MSTGIKVFAPDGTVILDSTMHVWSLVAAGEVKALTQTYINIPREVINSDIEVVITKLNRKPTDNMSRCVSGRTVERLTELFFDRENQRVLLEHTSTDIPNLLGIANAQLIYQLFNPYIDMLAEAARAVRGRSDDPMSLYKIRNTLLGEGCFSFWSSLGPECIANNYYYSDRPRDYTINNPENSETNTIHGIVTDWVQCVCSNSSLSQYIPCAILDVSTQAIHDRANANTINVLPTWSLSTEHGSILFNADGLCDTYVEVYAK